MKKPPPARRRFLRRLDAAHDDVGGAQVLDLLLGLVADAFAHGHQPDDGGDADEDAQHGQRGPQLVQHQRADAQPEFFEELAEHGLFRSAGRSRLPDGTAASRSLVCRHETSGLNRPPGPLEAGPTSPLRRHDSASGLRRRFQVPLGRRDLRLTACPGGPPDRMRFRRALISARSRNPSPLVSILSKKPCIRSGASSRLTLPSPSLSKVIRSGIPPPGPPGVRRRSCRAVRHRPVPPRPARRRGRVRPRGGVSARGRALGIAAGRSFRWRACGTRRRSAASGAPRQTAC